MRTKHHIPGVTSTEVCGSAARRMLARHFGLFRAIPAGAQPGDWMDSQVAIPSAEVDAWLQQVDLAYQQDKASGALDALRDRAALLQQINEEPVL